MEKLLKYIEEKMMPYVVKIIEFPYLVAIRDAFITFALPMIIVGSLFLILAFPPLPQETSIELLNKLRKLALLYRPVMMVPFQLSYGLMGFFISFGVAYNLGEYYKLDKVHLGMISIVAFLIVSLPIGVSGQEGIKSIGDFSLRILLNNLGGEGLFVAILVGVLVTEIFKKVQESGLMIEMPQGVPPRVTHSFEILLPALIIITIFWLLEWYISSNFIITNLQGEKLPATLPQLIMQFLKPLVQASDTYIAALLQIFLMMLLWSVGIHGMNIVSAVAYPFWTAALSDNIQAAAVGEQLPHIVTEPFFHMYTHLGGSGATLPLVFMLLRSRSKQLKQIGRVGLLPGIFNINEPITFGVPIAFNPLMVVPFILAPSVIVTINYLAMKIGLVAKPIAQLPLTVPVIIGGFLANHSISGALLQIFDLAIAAVIYYPFFKAWELKMVNREEE
ncbi:MAG: PTS system, cellobiose-specific IIC component [Candidatus Frackibacter sp. T328-2]|nr:MAG: PTS system, cellobiose-specific IIC component [Candidatus Frackibacter sp. T328-2]